MNDSSWMDLYHTALADKEELQRQLDKLRAERRSLNEKILDWWWKLLTARKAGSSLPIERRVLREMKDYLDRQRELTK